MLAAFFFSATALTASTLANPIVKRANTFPLHDGFPNPSSSQFQDIQSRAHGTLPNTPLPTGLSDEGITNFKLIAFNELFEVAFFSELVHNITTNVKGYTFGDDKDQVLQNLNVVLAVEELHALGANAILQTNKQDPIRPCKYNFPVSDFASAIDLAATITDVVLGTLQDVNDIFAQNTENGPVRLISSVIGNEGEQEGLFRVVQKKTTPVQPFLTTGTRDFAFSAIQDFVVPNSCPNIKNIPLKTFKSLNVVTQNIQPKNQKLTFTIDMADVDVDVGSLSLVLLHGLNAPIVEKLENIDAKNGVTTFTANFPFDKYLLHGLTIAAVTHYADSFKDAEAVANQTIFAPGIIEVN